MSTWKIHPVYLTIIEILQEKGSTTDKDLLEMLKAFYKEIGQDDLNRNLMTMEIAGLIYVSSLSRGKRLIQLKEK
jgi:Fe2+ or Zn2+ uptake regulation protein